MSFADKISGLMARPGEDVVPKDDVSWWMKTAGRGLGTVAGFMAIFCGMWMAIGIMLGDVSCLLGGLWQMIAGFMIIVCESPCCCKFVDFVQNVSDWIENRPHWNKAAIYGVAAIPPIILCPGLGSIFGSGLIFGTGVIYGMMSLGKKGSRDDMAAMAEGGLGGSTPQGAGGAGAATLMEDPDVWRPN